MGLLKLLVIVVVVYIVYKTIVQLNKDTHNKKTGSAGEMAIVAQLKAYASFTKTPVRIYQNAYITYKNGKTTEIDILALTNKQLYVIESKNYNGRINVANGQKNWYVNYRNGQSYTVYNPLMQNETHINALKNQLGIPASYMKSLVVFGNNTEIVGDSIENVINTIQLIPYISEVEQSIPDMPQSDIIEIDKLLKGCINKDPVTKFLHILNIKIKHGFK